MFYMLDRAMKATRLLSVLQRDRISGTKEQFRRRTEYPELFQFSRSFSESNKDESSPPSLVNADTLEAEIEALVKDAGASLRGPRSGGNVDTEEETGPPVELTVEAPTPNNFDCTVNGGHRDPRTWDPHVKITDAERTSAPGMKARGRPIQTSVIIGLLAIGCVLVASVAYFSGRAVSTSAATRAESSVLPADPKNRAPVRSAEVIGRVTADQSRIDEIATLAARVSAERPDSARRDQQKHATKSSPGVQQNAASTSSIDQRPKPSSKAVPFPETRPTTIAGWMVHDVVGSTAVLQGPNGVRKKVAPGDTLPELGKIESIVRWGNRWIVATSKGLISTP